MPTATPRPKASRAASAAAAPALSTTTAAPSRGADDEVSADCAGDAACAKQEAPPSEQARRLAAEVALLDRARAHLASGAFTAAADALSEHARTFDDGVLTAEAEVLRIDVLVQTKQRDQARARAAAFLLRYPSSPLAHRVRAISPALTPDAVGVPPLANP
ncbi:MAG: hypothetical protein IPI49_07220 [Myxococcales bacterium]|nr:hypothetical protein [Myxococcales bacterium]